MKFWIVDAFTDRRFAGNPACVVLPLAFPPDAVMQAMAAEHNLAETAFAVPQGDHYRLRWFTPTVEVDLCGHATLATAFVLSHLGRPGPYRFDTRSGLLTATDEGARVVLDFPARKWTKIEPEPGFSAGLARALGAEPVALLQSADLVAVLADAATVAGLRPDIAAIKRVTTSVIVTAQGGEGADITSRYFAPGYGIDEDPVTGSLHTQVVPYWAERLGRTALTCRQASARGGTVWCELAGERVKMAGQAVLYASGDVV